MEMVMAFAIFSMAVIVTLGIMNKGVALSQQSLETTLVRQQMDSQAEIIRYLHDTKNAAWSSIVPSKLATTVLPLNSNTCAGSSTLGSAAIQAFYVTPNPAAPGQFTISNVTTTTYSDAKTYARVAYPPDSGAPKSEGLWVQVAKAEDNAGIPAYDVYVHGCWQAAGQSQPMTLGTIVRLYGL